MQEWMTKIKEWWAGLAQREKRIVAVGGVLLSIFIIYRGVWLPLVNHVESMRQRIATNEKTLVWMKTADKELLKLTLQNKEKTRPISPVLLLSVLQKNIASAGLESQLTQLKQATNDSIEMHFQKVDFDKLMNLLITILKQQQVTVTQMSVIADSNPGIVNADVVLSLSA